MKWRVVGADRDTGERRDWIIEAATKQDAEREAMKRNAVIAHVAQIDEVHAADQPPTSPPRPRVASNQSPHLGDVLGLTDDDADVRADWRWKWIWGWKPPRAKPGYVHRLNRWQYPTWGIAHFQPIILVEISRRAWWQVYWLVVLLAITVPIIVALVYLLLTFCLGGMLAGALQDAANNLPRGR